MMTTKEVKAWLETLAPDSNVAVDEGGLTLIELDDREHRTGMYLEVGGSPVNDPS